ncbi:uncharacterized protein LOC114242682 [Bombyx mandarina]|uniref:Uncharacterized protein LOC114242682 n=1 Tax=Bombyx mandarina TaxID=7092 RepID=A0A6J2JKE3_BOMMA|nr:uncharacterized protein LOC114242682 [Bombyx mandarina]
MRITDDATKFYHILSILDRQYAAEVEDILTSPPDYNRLKDELIKRLSVSRENKVKQLLMHEQLGSRKPSQFLRHLQHLAGPGIPEDFVKTIWTSRLPTGLQPIIASQPSLSLDALAELADRVNDIATPVPQVASATTSTHIDELTRQVAELTKQVLTFTFSISNQDGSDEDIEIRIRKARGAFAQLKPVWESSVMTRRIKLTLFDSIVKSVLLFGCSIDFENCCSVRSSEYPPGA